MIMQVVSGVAYLSSYTYYMRPHQKQGVSINPNSVAILRCSRNFNACISNICGALKFLSRLV